MHSSHDSTQHLILQDDHIMQMMFIHWIYDYDEEMYWDYISIEMLGTLISAIHVRLHEVSYVYIL